MDVSAPPLNTRMSPEEFARAQSDARNYNRSIGKPADPGSTAAQVSQEQFLRLLTVQMSKQDPMNPLQNHEFMAQMAQFSALEQMVRMNKSVDQLGNSMGRMQANDLLGKEVTWMSDEGRVSRGTITKLQFEQDGKTTLFAGNQAIRFDSISSVTGNATPDHVREAYGNAYRAYGAQTVPAPVPVVTASSAPAVPVSATAAAADATPASVPPSSSVPSTPASAEPASR